MRATSSNLFLRKPVLTQLFLISACCIIGYQFIGFQLRFWRIATVAAGAVMILMRYKSWERGYLPLMLYVLLRLAWHSTEPWLIKSQQSAILCETVFFILEFVLLSWQLVKWSADHFVKGLYPLILATVTIWWLCENIFICHWSWPAFYTQMAGYLILMPVAAGTILESARRPDNLWMKTIFLCSLSVFFSSIIVAMSSAALITGVNEDMWYPDYFLLTRYGLDIVFNILYATAVICIPRHSILHLY